MAKDFLGNRFRYFNRSYILIKHFILRFINNDILTFDKPRRVNLIALLSLLTVSIGFFCHLQLRLYLFGLKPDPQKIWLEKTYFLTILMSLAGMVFTIIWDNLSLDKRDFTNLLILPVRPNLLFISKFLSIVVFVAFTTIVFNFFSTVIFSFYLTRQLNIDPLKFGIWHLLIHFLGYLFVFFMISTVQSLIKVLCKDKWYRKISNAVQIFLITIFVSELVWFPTIIYPQLDSLRRNSQFFKYAFPPLWFVGIADKLTGSTDSLFPSYLYIIIAAFTIPVGLYVLCMPQLYRKFLKFKIEKKKNKKVLKLKTIFRKTFDQSVLKNTLERGNFYFSLKTLNRSKRHKLHLLTSWIIPLMLIFVVMTVLYVKNDILYFTTINLYSISVPLFLICFLVLGMRTAMHLPINPAANWIFLSIRDHDKRNFVNGLIKAFKFSILVPLIIGFFLIYSYLWGYIPAFHHSIFCMMTSLLLIRILFLNYSKIPFVSPDKNPGEKDKSSWFFLLLGSLFYTYLFSRLGIFLITNPEYYILYYLGIFMVYSLTQWIHYYHFQELVFTYSTALDMVIVGLKTNPKN